MNTKLPTKHKKSSRGLVINPGADRDIMLSVIMFGFSVAFTRELLLITNYPQLSNQILHIAHSVWGGLLLLISTYLLLIFANKWIKILSAMISGVGAGLFIDEIGKFITHTNDYFFPPAAPIIYSIFLLIIILFLLLKKSRQKSPRASLYRVLINIRELLDDDLDPLERIGLLAELENASKSKEQHISLLAKQLSKYLRCEQLQLAPHKASLQTKINRWLLSVGRTIGRKRHLKIIIWAITPISTFTVLLGVILVWAWLSPANANEILSHILLTSVDLTNFSPVWLNLRLTLQLTIGTLYLISLIFFLTGYEKMGTKTAITATLLSLTVLDLLYFYLNQFGAMAGVAANLVALLLLFTYQKWYLRPIKLTYNPKSIL
ncbi:hypothetical protein H6764_02290 [Candidatus Nomurabacteria bacterium]|nr:hypothetical protein [Candidatus Nomurabacteria bacterium]